MLVFELRKDVSSQYFVRVVYNGRQIPLPVLTPASNGLYSLVDMTVYAIHVLYPPATDFPYFSDTFQTICPVVRRKCRSPSTPGLSR